MSDAVLVANRGLMFGGGPGSPFSLMCNEALGVTTSELPTVLTLSDGRMFAATSHGLQITLDGGCSWQATTPFGAVATPALTRHPTKSDVLYLTVYADGMSGIYVSDDAGKAWRKSWAADDLDYLRYLLIAPSEPEQLYVRKLGLKGMQLTYSVLRSSDAGATWESQDVALKDDETDLVLLGVNPKSSALLIAKAEAASPAATPERLLVSHDNGKTFDTPISLLSIAAVEWSEDGKTTWLGTDEGVYRSTDDARSFERVGESVLVSCLKRVDSRLYVCGYYRGANGGIPGVGVSEDGGETVEKWMALTDVVQPVACDASAPTASECSPWWADWKREILDGYALSPGSGGVSGAPVAAAGSGGAVAADAGLDVDIDIDDAGAAGSAADGGGRPEPVRASSGCQVGTGPTNGCGLWMLAGILIFVSRARHRGRRARASA